jgi:tRNA C32,U32 (ribose-2'-O)-methylase TrmJ
MPTYEEAVAVWNTRSAPAGNDGVREALANAEASFEFIRLKLVDCLNEPERSAFWKAVEARDAIRALRLQEGT